MSLAGVKVLEFAGLAPVPFCGMLLADFGASVIRIDRIGILNNVDVFSAGKRSIKIDIKHAEGKKIVSRMASTSDVLIEPFRPGVMEKLGLGPEILLKNNKRLIYARLTGYGQRGPLSAKAGHDINYLAMSGVLSSLGRKHYNPHPPVNLLADFAGGGLMAAFGILLALHERSRSDKGQIIDASMTHGAAYVGSFLWRSLHLPLWTQKGRGTSVLDGGAFFYDTYETQDGKFMAVGALEQKFFNNFMKGLGLDPTLYDQMSDSRELVTEIFRSKTRQQWTDIFSNLDACVTPVMELQEAAKDTEVNSTAPFSQSRSSSDPFPSPAPRLSRTPGCSNKNGNIDAGSHTTGILQDEGFSNEDISQWLKLGVVEENMQGSRSNSLLNDSKL